MRIDKIMNEGILNSNTITSERNSKVDFSELLLNSLEKVNNLQNTANKMDEDLVLGKTDNIHSVMIASQKAEISLSFAVEVRNKLLEAYKEIMRIQI